MPYPVHIAPATAVTNLGESGRRTSIKGFHVHLWGYGKVKSRQNREDGATGHYLVTDALRCPPGEVSRLAGHLPSITGSPQVALPVATAKTAQVLMGYIQKFNEEGRTFR